MIRGLSFLLAVLLLNACFSERSEEPIEFEVGRSESLLSRSQRRARAAQIRDAARAAGMTEGWLLAGIADAETGMSHCHSELTWACRGPASPDCGGGPVVAGAGDGPCSLRQGGLGMFQFDAGTFEETLARDGERVLRIDGNVTAAVEFVTRMVVRSRYISGVSTEAQAIAWMNEVRVGNSRWDPWVRTVVHYYNGCRPSFGCWSQRYRHYRDHTSGVFEEMGEEFWEAPSEPERAEDAARVVAQSFPSAREGIAVAPGEMVAGSFEIANEGTASWSPGAVFLATTEPRNRNSPIAHETWISASRVATVADAVEPGEETTLEFLIEAPMTPGEYSQYFNLVREVATSRPPAPTGETCEHSFGGVYADRGCSASWQCCDGAWRSGTGACGECACTDVTGERGCMPELPPEESVEERFFEEPGDAFMQLRVIVDSPTCEEEHDWICEGNERVRCEVGRGERQRCARGCEDGACVAAPDDADGDGHNTSVDCNDGDASIHPGADDPCGDEIDSDCDGIAEACFTTAREEQADAEPDAGVDAGVDAGGDAGVDGGDDWREDPDYGCSASGSARSQGWLVALLCLLGWRRRRC